MKTRFIVGTLEDLAKIIYDDEKMKKCYSFAPPSVVATRKSSKPIREEISWEEGGHIYKAVLIYCNTPYEYFFWCTFYTRDRKPATLTEIRNSYNRMTKEC